MANNTRTEDLIYENEYNIKDIVNKIKDIYAFFRKKFWRLFLFSLIGSLVGFTKAYMTPPIYTAKLKFLMKETSGSATLASSLGSLGSLLSGSGSLTSPLDRTLAVLGSEKIVGGALLKSIYVNNKYDLAINHFIDIQGLREKWKEDTLLSKVNFSTDEKSISFNLTKRKAYKSVLSLIIGERATILARNYDKKSGVFDLRISTSNESFSIEFCKLLYTELEQFMYNQSLTTSNVNVNILNKKIDSVKYELNSVQNDIARKSDRTLGLLMQEDKVDQKKLMVKEQLLTIMYGELQKNLETFKFINESINNGLEIIENPISPIRPDVKSKYLYSFIGFVFSGLICFGFLYSIKLYKDSLSK